MSTARADGGGGAGGQARPTPTPEQRQAADPSSSVWVTAAAGTGKTRVLADRVLRLLVGGTEPDQILGLTFTKAAAAEMVGRIQRDLGRFVTTADAKLDAELKRLLGRPAKAAERQRARGLLAKVLELPSGLPLLTIHGFCQSLLRRFPLEAEVPPHFEVLDPRSAADLWREALESVLANHGRAIHDALDQLARGLSDVSLSEGLSTLRERRLRLPEALRRGEGAAIAIAQLRTLLDAPAGQTAASVQAATCADPALDEGGLRRACAALGHGSTKDQARQGALAAWLAADQAGRVAGLADYRAAFLTQRNEPRKDLITKGALAGCPDALDLLLAEQARLAFALEREKAVAIAARSAALLEVGAAVLAAYDERKRQLAALDYDDLIEATGHLLDQTGAAAWVQYKLDQQIDHLLVDEGQDTSPAQWAIVEALAAEFFSGEGARPAGRTLFVVGDEKQSIMSFQGADLDSFFATRKRLGGSARGAGLPWREVPLQRSFRSAPTILALVDAVFADPEARKGVVGDGQPLRHESARLEALGMVEQWPLVRVDPPADAEPWRLPDQAQGVERKERLLARAIAERILGWRRDQTPLPETGRPIGPGDVMILLPRRGVLQDLIIRELKRHRIAVAGADRLALTEELAVMDLMALGDALLLPEDDLTLAAALKSPLLGLGEDDLFQLAHARGRAHLHERLLAAPDGRPAVASARFEELRRQADLSPPFELYARLLGEGGGRQRIRARLGPAALEPIEAFLAQALAYERAHPPSLQGFLHWLRADATELTRDPDQPRDEVRVLTVHGAKGLEAPIVFLTDTTHLPPAKDRLLWPIPGGPPLWSVGQQDREPISEGAWQQARDRQLQEHRRLLYVALTRARDWLIVTGCEQQSGEATWYQLIAAGLDRLGAEPIQMTGQVSGTGRRLGSTVGRRPVQLALLLAVERPAAEPAWLRSPAAVETSLARPLRPSHQEEDAPPPVASPRAASDTTPFARGRLIHRLLQALPDRPPVERPAALARFLARPDLRLDADAQRQIALEVEGILSAPGLDHLFAPGSRAEVPLAGVVGDRVIVGQVDRLAVTAEEVLVIDYKTNRAPPATAADVPLAYLRQMAAYSALIARIFPGRRVRSALLWTAGPRLMILGDDLLARHAPTAARA